MVVLLTILAIFSFSDTKELKFVNNRNGFVVLEQRGDKIFFNDPILEDEMKESGIAIPPADQEKYGGRERVKLGEEGFFRAFQEFYSVYIYDPAVYQWKPIDD